MENVIWLHETSMFVYHYVIFPANGRTNSLASISPTERHWLHPGSLLNQLRKKVRTAASEQSLPDVV